MKYRTRIQYTEADKALMWERWRQGESLQAIAQLFDRNHSTVEGILCRTGGMRPSARRRSALALKLLEREEISRAVIAGQSMRTMAHTLGRAPSTVTAATHRYAGCRHDGPPKEEAPGGQGHAARTPHKF